MAKSFNLTIMNSQEIEFLTKAIATYNNVSIDTNILDKYLHIDDPRRWASRHNYDRVNYLTSLPLEILRGVFDQSSLDSLMNLRVTSTTLKSALEAWGPFRASMTHGRTVVKALIATRASKLWTFSQLEDIIYTSQCHFCGEHGELVHLLKLRRVCFKCVTIDRRLMAFEQEELCRMMHLSPADLLQVPSLSSIQQSSFWGSRIDRTLKIYDYSAAIKLAQRKPTPLKPPRATTKHLVRWENRRSPVARGMRKRINLSTKHHAPICVRRMNKHNGNQRPTITPQVTDLPKFLFTRSGSSMQHACCVYLPARTAPTPTLRSQIIQARLCAGCSFYYNYHSQLPHQTHTLYPYTDFKPPTTANSKTSPLLIHLQTCIYARQYWKNLYPLHLNPDPSSGNPRLQANGGPSPPMMIAQEAFDHRISILGTNSSRFRHFPRHTYDETNTHRLNTRLNNEVFEMIPASFLDTGLSVSRIPKRTGLDLELQRKYEAGDACIRAMLDDTDDDQGTRTMIEEMREKKAASKERAYEVDTYADVLLAADDTVSQATWANPQIGRTTCLFRGWTSVLLDRLYNEMEYEERVTGRPSNAGKNWGFDRFGSVGHSG